MSVNEVFAQFPVLRTERLTLRQMRPADAEALFEFYSDEQLTRFLDWNGPVSLEQADELIAAWNRQFTEMRLCPWGITLTAEDRLIGSIMYMPVRGTFADEPLFPVTVGFELARSHWSKGIMSEALQAVLIFGREKLHVHRVQAEVLPENKASLRLLEKCGFRQEGVLRQYLLHEVSRVFMDVIILALLSS